MCLPIAINRTFPIQPILPNVLIWILSTAENNNYNVSDTCNGKCIYYSVYTRTHNSLFSIIILIENTMHFKVYVSVKTIIKYT